jgi:hypothetical protein
VTTAGRRAARGRRCATLMAFAVLPGAAVSGCGSSGSGLAAEPASQVLRATVKAFDSSTSFHLSASAASNSQTFRFSLELFRNGDAAGTIDDAGTPIKLIAVGGFVYIEAPTAFWEHGSVPMSTVTQLDGKYAKLPQSASGSIDQFTYSVIAGRLSDPGRGALTNKGTTTIDGQSVVKLQFTATSGTGQIYVAASGSPFPVDLDNLGGNGNVAMSGWDRGSPPAPPTNEITLPDS